MREKMQRELEGRTGGGKKGEKGGEKKEKEEEEKGEKEEEKSILDLACEFRFFFFSIFLSFFFLSFFFLLFSILFSLPPQQSKPRRALGCPRKY